MPGASNQPQPMLFDGALNWFTATGIPSRPTTTPATRTRIHAPADRADGSGNVLATTTSCARLRRNGLPFVPFLGSGAPHNRSRLGQRPNRTATTA